MSEIVTERFEGILRIQFNRPEKKNAMTMSMYSTVAELLDAAAKDEEMRVVLLHGAGDAFCAGNDLGDFLHNPPKSDDSPQARFIHALIEFDKPLVAAVHGVAIGGGTTMLTHFDFVYAAEHTRFQMPFVNLALVPELGTSYWLPAQIGYLAAIYPLVGELRAMPDVRPGRLSDALERLSGDAESSRNAWCNG